MLVIFHGNVMVFAAYFGASCLRRPARRMTMVKTIPVNDTTCGGDGGTGVSDHVYAKKITGYEIARID